MSNRNVQSRPGTREGLGCRDVRRAGPWGGRRLLMEVQGGKERGDVYVAGEEERGESWSGPPRLLFRLRASINKS